MDIFDILTIVLVSICFCVVVVETLLTILFNKEFKKRMKK